ncbi:MAG: DNA primase, partial [Novosphingobium sp.]
FSAYAYPPRPQRDWKPGGRPAPPRRSDPQSAARLRKQTGSRDALSAAVLAGLLRFPNELARHGDTLSQAELPDPRFSALVDAIDAGEALETGHLGTILAARGMAAPDPGEYASLRFGFLSDEAAPEQSCADLAQAVGLLVERPALEAALAEATSRFERDLSDGAYAEQQRLLKRKLEFDARLRQMASARIAAPAGAASHKTAD